MLLAEIGSRVAALSILLLRQPESPTSEMNMKFLNYVFLVGFSALVGCSSEDKSSLKTRDVPIELSESTNSVGMKFKSLPAGSYTTNITGSTETIEVAKPIEFGVHEVTQAQYEAVMNANPSKFRGDSNPVENVRWEGIDEFCRRLSDLPEEKAAGHVYRLPTQEEWEYACRAGAELKNRFDHHLSDLGTYAWFSDNADGITHPVGNKEPNAWGIYDMYGNVWEWCNVLDQKQGEHLEGPTASGLTNVTGTICLGGSWASGSGLCKTGVSQKGRPNYQDDRWGFRVVRIASDP